MFQYKEVVRSSGFSVYLNISTPCGRLEWMMVDMVNGRLVTSSVSRVDAESWLVRLGRMEWAEAEYRVDEAIAWAQRVMCDQDIVLHDAQASSSTTGAAGQ